MRCYTIFIRNKLNYTSTTFFWHFMIAALFFTVKKDRIENLAAELKKIGQYLGRTGVGRTGVGRTDVRTQRLRNGMHHNIGSPTR